MSDGFFFLVAASQPANCSSDVLVLFCFSLAPLSELHRRSHARAEVFFYPSDGGLCLGKCPAKMLS